MLVNVTGLRKSKYFDCLFNSTIHYETTSPLHLAVECHLFAPAVQDPIALIDSENKLRLLLGFPIEGKLRYSLQ